MIPEKRSIRRRGIYLLPNLFTTGALFAGFYAITSAMGGRFETAGRSNFVAMILDGLDGRVARLTNTQSESALNTIACRIWFRLVQRLPW